MANRLTNNQLRFITEYVKSGNATEAWGKAGYGKGQKREAWMVNSCKMLAKPHIKAEVDKLMQKVRDKLETPAIDRKSRILQALEKVAFSDEVTENVRAKYLEMLGKFEKMFTDKVEHSGSIGFTLNIAPPPKDNNDSDNE